MKDCMRKLHRENSDDEPRAVVVKKQIKKALIIGINYVGTSSQLSGCINDANKMKNYLVNKCAFPKQNIVMLCDHFTAKAHELPTRANIIRKINWLTRNLPKDKDCQLVFHYSGHGSYTYDREREEKDRRDETICPVDYSISGDIKDDDLRVLLVDPLPANAKLFCLMDCCHSGTGLDLRYECRVYGRGKHREYKLAQEKKLKKSKGEVILFSGCKDKQYSADAYIKGKYQGAMTWAFFEVLNKYGDKPISYKRLLRELRDLLAKKRYEQVPQLTSGQYVDLKSKFCLVD
jgi:uncharacterized caspase-like protein